MWSSWEIHRSEQEFTASQKKETLILLRMSSMCFINSDAKPSQPASHVPISPASLCLACSTSAGRGRRLFRERVDFQAIAHYYLFSSAPLEVFLPLLTRANTSWQDLFFLSLMRPPGRTGRNSKPNSQVCPDDRPGFQLLPGGHLFS